MPLAFSFLRATVFDGNFSARCTTPQSEALVGAKVAPEKGFPNGPL
jgi:hypothetical protein